MHCLFLFMDGVGLGISDPDINPFARANTPNLNGLLGNKPFLLESLTNGAAYSERASLLALDACLGIEGVPQSATGQAVLLTGINIPAKIGYHYGPKPNQEVAHYLVNGNVFNELARLQRTSALLNAYPPSYFSAIRSGRRIFSSIPLAATSAGISLKTEADLLTGRAIAADFTAEGWHTHLKLSNTPRLSLEQAGARLAELGRLYDFSLFEFWLSDYAGHKQEMGPACDVIERFDRVLGSLLANWDNQDGLILLTSDHGNLEDLSIRRHTTNPVPRLLIGSPELRSRFDQYPLDITSITPGILSLLGTGQLKS
jgi:2,3-bisphosphoglycerate-independent phosphoglycerate mutase